MDKIETNWIWVILKKVRLMCFIFMANRLDKGHRIVITLNHMVWSRNVDFGVWTTELNWILNTILYSNIKNG